jgi:hypothetical protein
MQESLIMRDATATCAAHMLHALSVEDETIAFPDLDPRVRDATDAMLSNLHERCFLSDEQTMFSYVEPGCLEHNVVHVLVWDGAPHSRTTWLIIDPVTGNVERA